MVKRVSASDAKNNFGGLLDNVASLGRVEIMKHGRLVAVVLSPRELEGLSASSAPDADPLPDKHMIPAHLARSARMLRKPGIFDDD